MTSSLLATVAIPTLNGETYLARLLDAVFAQQIDGSYDVLIIDSGSTDGTLDIIASYPDVRLHSIPQAEFGHGRTRNLAAEMSTAQYMVYLTQDAIPLGNSWLHDLLLPLRQSDMIAGVFGPQAPRPNCPPLIKYEIYGVFGAAGVGTGVTINAKDWTPEGAEDRATFFSDVNSAIRRSLLVGEIPFRDVPYAEDQFFATDALEAGYWKAFAPLAAVEHSNDVTLSEYRQRIFDEGLALHSLGKGIQPGGALKRLMRVARGSLADTRRILKDRRSLGRKATLKWLFVNPLFHRAKWAGYHLAAKAAAGDTSLISQYSLEHQRKKLAQNAE